MCCGFVEKLVVGVWRLLSEETDIVHVCSKGSAVSD